LRSKVSDFLLLGVVLGDFGEELSHLHSSDFSHISNVMQCLNLIKMHLIMSGPQGEVIVHGKVKSLHVLGPNTTLLNSAVDLEFSIHEALVLSFNLIDNVWGVDIGSEAFPVDFSEVLFSISFKVIVVKNSLQLGLLLSCDCGVSSDSKSLEPVVGELVVY